MLTVAQQHAASGRRASVDDTWSMLVEGSGGTAAAAGAAPREPPLTGSSPSMPMPLNDAWMCGMGVGDVGLVMCSTHAEDGDEDDVSLPHPLALRVNVDALRGRAAGFPPHAVGWDTVACGDNVCYSEVSTRATAPKELWHEVTVQPFIDPTTGEAALLVTQSDATGRAKTEETLSKMVEVSA